MNIVTEDGHVQHDTRKLAVSDNRQAADPSQQGARTRSQPLIEPVLLANISLALRSLASMLLAYGILFGPSDHPLPAPFIGPAIAIMVVGPSLGATLLMAKDFVIATGIATILTIPVAIILVHRTSQEYEMALPFVVALLTAAMNLMVPARGATLATTVAFLMVALPLRSDQAAQDTKQGVFQVKLLATFWVGIASACVSLTLPLPRPSLASTDAKGQLERAQRLASAMVVQLVGSAFGNDSESIAKVEHIGNRLTRTLEELRASSQPATLEWRLIGRSTETRHLAWLKKLQVLQPALNGMRHAIMQRHGESIRKDQQIYIQLVAQPMNTLTRAVGEALKSPASEPKPELRPLIQHVEEQFLEARRKVFLGEEVTPVFEHTARRNAFFLCFLRVAEELCEGPSAEPPPTAPPQKMDMSQTLRRACGMMMTMMKGPPRSRLIRPAKMALAMSLASLWVSIPELHTHSANGMWVGVTVALVTSADVGSSFEKTAARLWGTMIASMFGLVTLRAISLYGKVTYSNPLVMTALAVFVFGVGLFRRGARPYAMTCAAFTSPIIFLGGYVMKEEAHGLDRYVVSRVEQTFVGVTIYLILELLLWPTFAQPELRKSVRSFFQSAAAGLADVADVHAKFGRLFCPDALASLKEQCQECRQHIAKAKYFLIAAEREPNLGREPPIVEAEYARLASDQTRCIEQLELLHAALSALDGDKRSVTDPNSVSLLVDLTRKVSSQFAACSACWDGVDLFDMRNHDNPIEDLAIFRKFAVMRLDLIEEWARFWHTKWVAYRTASEAASREKAEQTFNEYKSRLDLSLATSALLEMCTCMQSAGKRVENIIATWPWTWPALEEIGGSEDSLEQRLGSSAHPIDSLEQRLITAMKPEDLQLLKTL